MSVGNQQSQLLLDSEESKNIAVVHKTNQGYSGKDLWKLKQERPELFGARASAGVADGVAPAPPGYEVDHRLGAGWLYNRERDIYMNKETRKRYVCDLLTNELCELGEGRDMSSMLSVRGDAAACVGKDGLASRHVIINDLHRAAASMKLHFSQHDTPAALFAVYDTLDSSAAVVEAAAKSLHVRLLPRLAAHRGQWQNDRLERVLSETLQGLGMEIGPGVRMRAAIALMLGGRLILASTGGAMCLLFGKDGMASGGMDDYDVVSEGQQPVTHCVVLEECHLGLLLTVESIKKAGLSPVRIRSLARSHVAADRPRAACLNVIGEAQRCSAEVPLVAAAARFTWGQQDLDGAPNSKKPRTEPSAKTLGKVRCRHILLRHTTCQAQMDRGKPKATRTVGEAEDMLLRALPELGLGGSAAFTAWCKKNSDCETALRGGDLAGDLGWLDRDPAKNRKVPAAVIRAAFTLATGQLSDIVTSERGVHLLLRTA